MKSQKFITKQLAIAGNDILFNYIDKNNFKRIGNQILNDVSILIVNPQTFVSDKNEVKHLMQTFHNSPTGGHIGINRLYKKLRNLYIWPNMGATITKFVKTCELCIRDQHFTPIKPF